MIAAYPQRPSVRAGERLRIFVDADAPQLRARIVRCGEHAVTVGNPHAIDTRAGCFDIRIPSDWTSGVYVVTFDRDGTIDAHLDRRDARALFIVRAAQPQSAILYNVPIFTYHAYNVAHDPRDEGTCLYNGAPAVSLLRAGGGIGGHVWNERIADVYAPNSPRQTFVHWDLPAIRWLERRMRVDYCCDLDLHDTPDMLDAYAVLVAFGHHEYWSDAMRSALEHHLARGGNAAFFTGNTCWFRVRYEPRSQTIGRIAGRWNDWPEEHTFGVSYRYGGGKWDGGRPPSGFTVRDAAHWIFDGCGVRNGDVFGDEERVVGYECDGAPFDPPDSLRTLADASLVHWPVHDGSGEIAEDAHATMGIVRSRGSLFISGSVDWPRVLASGEQTVERITENVIRRFAG